MPMSYSGFGPIMVCFSMAPPSKEYHVPNTQEVAVFHDSSNKEVSSDPLSPFESCTFNPTAKEQ